MARMICTCGANLSNHEAPNDIELIVYTDREWDNICNCDSLQPWKIPLPKYNIWRCPKCKSVYVFERDKSEPIMIYRLE